MDQNPNLARSDLVRKMILEATQLNGHMVSFISSMTYLQILRIYAMYFVNTFHVIKENTNALRNLYKEIVELKRLTLDL